MKVRVHYEADGGTILLRSDRDWDADVEPSGASRDGRHDFELADDLAFRYFKPVLRRGDELLWAQGDNYLALRSEGVCDAYPYFTPDDACHECTKHVVPASFEERGYAVRVFVPPGYDENQLERLPVLYMHDGQNLFFPDEAFGGTHWDIVTTLRVLRSMCLVRRMIVVGVYACDRMRDYTSPGYGGYGRFLVEELLPWIDARYRTLGGPEHTATLGSSLGGVVSLHLGLGWPDVFGHVACLSSTFGYRDDLRERITGGGKQPVRVYLDSGWPRDNYEATREVADLLEHNGWERGRDVLHLAFPHAKHDETAWASRVHVPLQFLFGRCG